MEIIHGSGGVQCYVAAKSKWLEEHGWHVVVISNCNPKTKRSCILQSLNKYIKYGNRYTLLHPSNLPKFVVDYQLSKMLKSIGFIKAGEDVVIESWDSQTAQWSELIASRLNGRHLFWTAAERYRMENQQYESKIDFFKFKMNRGEILTSVVVANRLFEGYQQYIQREIINYPIISYKIE